MMVRTAVMLGVLIGAFAHGEDLVVRVVSYNIHHGEGLDGEIDLERIARAIRDLAPQVVCLQEVDRGMVRTNGRDFPRELSGLLGMEAVFGANLEQNGGEYGNATLTDLPILDSENIRLPVLPGEEPRGCLRVTVEIDGRPLDILNTHFGLRVKERRKQANAIMELPLRHPAVLTGDLNEETDAPGVSTLLERFDPALPPGADGTYSAANPTRKIDYILVTKELSAENGRVMRSDQTSVASDHLPIVADVRLPGERDIMDSKGLPHVEDDRVRRAVERPRD